MRCGSRPAVKLGKAAVVEEASDRCTSRFRRGIGASMSAQGNQSQHGRSPAVSRQSRQQDVREEQAWPLGKSERPIVVMKPGNAGGAKGPWFHRSVGSSESRGDWREPTNPTEG